MAIVRLDPLPNPLPEGEGKIGGRSSLRGRVGQTQTLNFLGHPPRQHHPDHFVVAHKRPQRILKRRRSVFLDKEVSDPGHAIARDQSQRKQPPTADRNEVTDQAERN